MRSRYHDRCEIDWAVRLEAAAGFSTGAAAQWAEYQQYRTEDLNHCAYVTALNAGIPFSDVESGLTLNARNLECRVAR